MLAGRNSRCPRLWFEDTAYCCGSMGASSPGTARSADGSHPAGAIGTPPRPVTMNVLTWSWNIAAQCGANSTWASCNDAGKVTRLPARSSSGGRETAVVRIVGLDAR